MAIQVFSPQTDRRKSRLIDLIGLGADCSENNDNSDNTEDRVGAKHQNCHFWELKEELKRTEKNLKELKLSK